MTVAVGATSGSHTDERSRRGVVALGLVMLVGMSALSGAGGLVGAASATNHATITNCGETIDSSGTYELSADLTHAGNSPCLVISGSNVILDGNDHTLTGDAAKDTGILVPGGAQRDVTVRNLDVVEFQTGVELTSVSGATVDGVTVTDANETGIVVDSSTVSIHGSSVDNPSYEYGDNGIRVAGGTDVDVSITDTVVTNADSGVIGNQPGLVTTNLTVDSNRNGLSVGGPNQIHTNLSAVDNARIGVSAAEAVGENGPTITGAATNVSGNGRFGIDLADANGATIQGPGINVSANGLYGIENTDSSHVVVSGVELRNNGGAGINVDYADDVRIEDVSVAGGGEVEGRSVGISVTDTGEAGVVIRNADVRDVPDSGVYVGYGSDVMIEGSETTLRANGGHGVYARSCSGECSPTTVQIADATVADNEGTELIAFGTATIDATNVDVGATLAADTTVDAELSETSLTSLATFEGVSISSPPAGYETLDRYVLLQRTAESGGYADVTLHYTDSDVAGLDESTVTMLGQDAEAESWNTVAQTLDEEANTVSINVTSPNFLGVGLFAEPEPEPTPTPEPAPAPPAGGGGGSDPGTPSIIVTDATVTDDSIEPGDTVRVNVTLRNRGDGNGVEEVNLTVDGETVDSQEVFVGAGTNNSFDFEYTVDDAGEYSFAAGNQSAGIVSATRPSTPTPVATETPTPTPTPEPTPELTVAATPTDSGGAAPTPADSGGGGPGLFVIVGLVAVVGGVVGAGWLLTRET